MSGIDEMRNDILTKRSELIDALTMSGVHTFAVEREMTLALCVVSFDAHWYYTRQMLECLCKSLAVGEIDSGSILSHQWLCRYGNRKTLPKPEKIIKHD